MNQNEKINYIEFPAKNLELAKHFFTTVFDWHFTDYGPEYITFTHAGLEGGFYKAELTSSTENGSALVIIYSDDLLATESKIKAEGGLIIKPTFDFPGGRRFHFSDPNGNELAVWSKC